MLTVILLLILFALVIALYLVESRSGKPNPLEGLSEDFYQQKNSPQTDFDPEKPITGLIKRADHDLIYLSDKIHLIERDLTNKSSFEKLENDFSEFRETFEQFRKDLMLELGFVRSEVFFKKFNEKRSSEELSAMERIGKKGNF